MIIPSSVRPSVALETLSEYGEGLPLFSGPGSGGFYQWLPSLWGGGGTSHCQESFRGLRRNAQGIAVMFPVEV